MPPQQTNLTPETGRDAAGLRLDPAIALVKDTTGDALAEACPDASIAALRDAFSEKEAAGPPVASTRSLLGLLQGYWRALRNWRQRARSRVSLHDLSDRELMDIGLTQGEIDCLVAGRAIERLREGTTYLWLSRGVM
ncbi:DUF1127 domain-containing protein [Bradyrhizobium septentrionale]|uniref:DUF1127 domain-containing protein n=1 Tax=Bradyrhizobium septentrionale TaxID=1404411 RepID=A0A974A5F2_9BRAD|nr:DUF1127 domain-containing protein [Bradyrhizobium septentrionale]UGY17309.1 DUF1127 domain-containing protein [Bradyrhizobium septentrionale]UGY26052.1 DUF1127 domain-containing protein [Bradyrhizobium septentrionale]